MLMAKPYEILNKQIVESVDTWTRTSAKFTGKLKSATREVGRIQESTEHLIKTARSYMEVSIAYSHRLEELTKLNSLTSDM